MESMTLPFLLSVLIRSLTILASVATFGDGWDSTQELVGSVRMNVRKFSLEFECQANLISMTSLAIKYHTLRMRIKIMDTGCCEMNLDPTWARLGHDQNALGRAEAQGL